MNTLQLNKYVTELIQIVNANIRLANDISSHLDLPVNESLARFGETFRSYLFDNRPQDDGELASENARLREEVDYINASSLNQKSRFTEKAAALRSNIEKLEESLRLTRDNHAKCHEQLERARGDVTAVSDELTSCRTTNDAHLRELETLRQRLIDESDVFRNRIEASNAMSEVRLTDIEAQNQAKFDEYVKTIVNLREQNYRLGVQIKTLETKENSNDELQAMLANQSTLEDIETIEALEVKLRETQELVAMKDAQCGDIRDSLVIMTNERDVALVQIHNIESELQSMRDQYVQASLLNEQISSLTNEKSMLNAQILSLNTRIEELNEREHERAEYEAMLVDQSTIDDIARIEELEASLLSEKNLCSVKLDEALTKIASLEDDLREKIELFARTERRHNQQSAIQRDESLRRMESLEAELNASRQRVEETDNQRLKLQTHIDSLYKERTRLMNENARLESDLKLMRESIIEQNVASDVEKSKVLATLQDCQTKLQQAESEFEVLRDQISTLNDEKIRLAVILQESEQTIRELHANRKDFIMRGVNSVRHTLEEKLLKLVRLIDDDNVNVEALRMRVKRILSEFTSDTGIVALLLPKFSYEDTKFIVEDSALDDLMTKLTSGAGGDKRKIVETFLRESVNATIDKIHKQCQIQLEALQNELAINKQQTTEYTSIIERFMQTRQTADLEILLKHEIRMRDDKISKLETMINSIPESTLNDRIRKMSVIRRNQLIDILTKFTTKITPYDASLGDKLKTHMSMLNREFDEVFDYVDNLVSTLTDINIMGFSKLSQSLNSQTLTELATSVRDVREKLESNSPTLHEEYTRLLGEIQLAMDFVADSPDTLTMLAINDKITNDTTQANYQELLREVTAFRDNVSAEKTRILRQQLANLMDMKNVDASETTTTTTEPTDFFIIVNELELTKDSKSKLLGIFKSVIERNQTTIDELTRRLRQTELELNESKRNAQSNAQSVDEMLKRLNASESLVKSLRVELSEKNDIISNLQSTKKQQETLMTHMENSNGDVESMSKILGSVSDILRKYNSLCRASTNSKLLQTYIDKMHASTPLISAVEVLDSISKLLSTFVRQARNSRVETPRRKRRLSNNKLTQDVEKPKTARYSDDEEDLIAMNNQQMFMQMVYGGKSATESQLYADECIKQLKCEKMNADEDDNL